MDTLSAAEVFWSALVLAGVAAEVLERLARRRRAHRPVAGSSISAVTGTATDGDASPAGSRTREPAMADGR